MILGDNPMPQLLCPGSQTSSEISFLTKISAIGVHKCRRPHDLMLSLGYVFQHRSKLALLIIVNRKVYSQPAFYTPFPIINDFPKVNLHTERWLCFPYTKIFTLNFLVSLFSFLNAPVCPFWLPFLPGREWHAPLLVPPGKCMSQPRRHRPLYSEWRRSVGLEAHHWDQMSEPERDRQLSMTSGMKMVPRDPACGNGMWTSPEQSWIRWVGEYDNWGQPSIW